MDKFKIILILGTPRSGTSKLVSDIEENFNVSSCLETHFIPYFYKYKFLWGDLNKLKNRKKLLEAIYAFLKIWTFFMFSNFTKRTDDIFHENNILITEKYLNEIVSNSNDFSSLIENIYKKYCEINKTSACIEKSAYFENLDLDFINNVFSDVRVIHYMREPRMVVSSWLKINEISPSSKYEGYKQWSSHFLNYSRWGYENPQKYLNIKFEDMLTDNIKIINKVSKFLGLRKVKIKKQSESSKLLSQFIGHNNINQKHIAARMYEDNITNKMPIFSEFHETHKRAGYCLDESSAINLTFFEKLLYEIRAFLSINNLKRKIKSYLPVLIWLCQILKIIFFINMFLKSGKSKQ